MYNMQLLYVFSLIIFTVALDISGDNVKKSIENIENEKDDTTEDYDVEIEKVKILKIIVLFMVISIFLGLLLRCCLIGHRIAIHLWQTRRETLDESRLQQHNQSRIEHQIDDDDQHIEERRHRRKRTNKLKEECKYDERDKRMHENRDSTDIVLNYLKSMDNDSDKYSIFELSHKRVFSGQTSQVHSPRINNSRSNSDISIDCVELVELNPEAQVYAKERNDD